MDLRPYQTAASTAVYDSLRQVRSTLLVLPTGTGKTIVFASIARRAADHGRRVLILAHREELIEQAVDKLRQAVGLEAAVEMAEHRQALAPADQVVLAGDMAMPDRGQDGFPLVVVGTVQSMVRRLDQFDPDHFNLVIVDECFPAGTAVDGRSIEQLRIGDRVTCVDHSTGTLSARRITRVFKSIPSSMVMVRLSHGASIVCTPNHPFFVPGIGYIPAAQLQPHQPLLVRKTSALRGMRSDLLLEVPPRVLLDSLQEGSSRQATQDGRDVMHELRSADDSARPNRVDAGPAGSRLLLGHVQNNAVLRREVIQDGCYQQTLRIGSHEGQQPDAKRSEPSQDVGHTSADRPCSRHPRRQRTSADRARAVAVSSPGLAHTGDCQDEKTARLWISDPLQDRHSQPGRHGGYRDRRCRSRHPDPEGARCEKNSPVAVTRVESVEVLERGSDGRFGGLCPDGHVYNLEIANCGNYFADGVLVHNCHHVVAETYRKILDHFGSAKILGVTATPDRGDKKALAQAFDDVAHVYEIQEAIEDGWLVPIHQQYVECDELDFSRCRTTAGDLNQGDLDGVMGDLKALHAVAGPIVELAGDRPTLVFTVSVAHAHGLAEVLREYTQAPIAALDGTSPKDERRQIVEAFRRGDVKYLTNCALFTEGFDAPPTACIAMARPTKSRALYAQMLGRGTRPLSGLVDPLAAATPEVRRQAIAQSAKTDLLVLDFVGNSGRHSLVNAIDVLDGEATDFEVNLAREALRRGEIADVLEALRNARKQIKALELERLRQQARKGYRVMQIDPFAALGVDRNEDSWGRELTEKQAAFLERKGINSQQLDRAQASRLIGTLITRHDQGLATYKQANRLIKSGLDPAVVWRLSFDEASGLMNELARNRWATPLDWHARFSNG